MNKQRRQEIQSVIGMLDAQMACVDELASEERDYFENMPESMKYGEKGSAAEAASDALDSAKDALQEVIDYLQEALA